MQISKLPLSALRYRLGQIVGDIDRLLPVFYRRHRVTQGVLYQQKRRCGKPNCHCARGQRLHKSWVLSRSVGGHVRLKMVGIEELLDLRKRTLEYRRFRGTRAELRKCFQKLLDVIDAIERLRRTDKIE